MVYLVEVGEEGRGTSFKHAVADKLDDPAEDLGGWVGGWTEEEEEEEKDEEEEEEDLRADPERLAKRARPCPWLQWVGGWI